MTCAKVLIIIVYSKIFKYVWGIEVNAQFSGVEQDRSLSFRS